MASESRKGIVYIVQNPAFPHLFKIIGRTGKGIVKDKSLNLNASNVPEDFVVLFGYKCNNLGKLEKYLENIFSNFRHYTKTGRKTEFFYIGCLSLAEGALEILRAEELKEISIEDKDVLLKEISLKEDYTVEYDETKNIEKLRKRGPLFTFSKLNIKPGTTLVFMERGKQGEECIVVNSIDDRTVLYKGKEYNLSPLARKLRKNNAPCRGLKFFRVKDDTKTLAERFDEME